MSMPRGGRVPGGKGEPGTKAIEAQQTSWKVTGDFTGTKQNMKEHGGRTQIRHRVTKIVFDALRGFCNTHCIDK